MFFDYLSPLYTNLSSWILQYLPTLISNAVKSTKRANLPKKKKKKEKRRKTRCLRGKRPFNFPPALYTDAERLFLDISATCVEKSKTEVAGVTSYRSPLKYIVFHLICLIPEKFSWKREHLKLVPFFAYVTCETHARSSDVPTLYWPSPFMLDFR